MRWFFLALWPCGSRPDPQPKPSETAREVAHRLWARVDCCKRDNVERECWKILARLGRRRSGFVIYGFPDAAAFLNDKRLMDEFGNKPTNTHATWTRTVRPLGLSFPRSEQEVLDAVSSAFGRLTDQFLAAYLLVNGSAC